MSQGVRIGRGLPLMVYMLRHRHSVTMRSTEIFIDTKIAFSCLPSFYRVADTLVPLKTHKNQSFAGSTQSAAETIDHL